MANSRTGFRGVPRLCLLLSFFLACSLWHTISSKNIQPSCFTDFDSKAFCTWEVAASTDCSKEFLMHVATTNRFNGQRKSWECSAKNKRSLNVTTKCTCTIWTKELDNFQYNFSVKANGKEIWNMTSVDISKIVQPRPPINLHIKKGYDRYLYILTWEDDYHEEHILHKNLETDYEVSYWQEGLKNQERTRQTPDMQLKMSTAGLMPGTTYVAKVRQKHYFFGNIWSEWSVPISWQTDGGYMLTYNNTEMNCNSGQNERCGVKGSKVILRSWGCCACENPLLPSQQPCEVG